MAQEQKLRGEWRLNYHVSSVATLNGDQAGSLLFGVGSEYPWETWTQFKPRELWVTIDYPLEEGVRIHVRERDYADRGYASLGKFLLFLAKEYEKIYKNPKKYGIWGHNMPDLYFESVTIDDKGEVVLGMGS